MSLDILLVFLLLIIFPLGQLTRLPLNIPQVNIYFHDLIIVLLVLIWLSKKIFTKEKIGWPFLTKPILSFAIISCFSLILAFPYFKSGELVIALFYLLRWITYSGLYFVLVDLLKKNNQLGNKIYKLMIMIGIIAAILGLIQYIFLPDIRPLTVFGWDPHYYRVVGSYLDPSFTALIYVLALILIGTNLDYGIIFAFIYLALALTYSRSGYLAYLTGMTIIAWYKKSIKFWLIVLGVGVLTILLLPRPKGEGVKLERQSTIWARINNWKQALTISSSKPVFGIGFNTYRYVQKEWGFLDASEWQVSHAGAGADNSFLFVLATTGIMGLTSYLGIIGQIKKRFWERKNITIISTIGAVIVHALFNNSLFYSWVMIWLWLIIALNEEVKDYK